VPGRFAARVRKFLEPEAEAARSDATAPDGLAFAHAESVNSLRGKPPDRCPCVGALT